MGVTYRNLEGFVPGWASRYVFRIKASGCFARRA